MENNLNCKKILVTGASGFLGRHLVNELTKDGYSVRALVRKTSKCAQLKNSDIELHYGDLNDPESIRAAVEGTDIVVHAAAAMKGSWDEYLESTVRGTERLLEAAKNARIERFIYISSIAVYDMGGILSSADSLSDIDEDAPYAEKGISYYEKSKIEAEKLVCRYNRDYGLSTVIIRPGPIYGEDGSLYPSRLGFSFGADRFMIIGSGKVQLPLVYAGNLSKAIALSIRSKIASGRVYNVVDDGKMTQKDFLLKVKEMVNPELAIIHLPYAAALCLSGILGILLKLIGKRSPIRKEYLFQCSRQINYSNARIKKELGWASEVGSTEALTRTLKWHKAKTTPIRDVDLKELSSNFRLGKTFKTAVIGCGQIAHEHLKILNKIKDVKIAGICDIDIDAAGKLAKQYGVNNVYSEVKDMLDDVKPDIVHILTPPQFHRDLAILAINAKCNVLLEKPMAMNSAEAREVMEAAKENNVQLCIDHNHLYDPVMIQARKLVAKGCIGDIVYVESWYGFNLGSNLNSRYMVSGAKNHWAMNMPGKLYQNLISHPLSVLVDLIGYPEQISAMAVSSGVVKAMDSDELRVMVRCDGKIGLISVSLSVNPRYQILNIYGTKGSIFLDFLNKTLIKENASNGIPKAVSRMLMNISKGAMLLRASIGNMFRVIRGNFTPYEGIEILIREFYKSVADGRGAPVSADDGFKSAVIMDNIWSQITL